MHNKNLTINRQFVAHFSDEYWQAIPPPVAMVERDFERTLSKFRAQGSLDKETFVKIAMWKCRRNERHYLANSEAAVRAQTAAAFTASRRCDAIKALCALKGVKLRTAVALLHWMRPGEFPMLDYRVVEVLCERIPLRSGYENTSFYERIAQRLIRVAMDLGVSLRELDRALWASHKLI